MAQSDYKRGNMIVEDHKGTFGGFVAVSIWATGLLVIIVLMATLIFAAKFAFLPSLIATFIVGVIYGLVLKMSLRWYAILFFFAIFAVIVAAIGALL
ncbi:aa3-type cytochrome c oxidase subunit IV [Robiginitomaculum antarcticum]|uniref:aa3-type cytochrome c oxidase subunit IV n=1 Tax=Robiginitomaculum antarcticum TaxID=437507 RepID=UPI00036D94B6|nr:aa3-type cytochrome c oxidase subunit IV [Robiginitomaculum antarcticum]